MDAESRINAALGKMLRYFNLLELNVGLWLRRLENPVDPSKSNSFLNRAGLQQILLRIKNELENGEFIGDSSEFHDWIERVEDIRIRRNHYVHGIWEYLPLRSEAPLGFQIPPWKNDTIMGSVATSMRLEDLEADAARVEELFYELTRMREKYGV